MRRRKLLVALAALVVVVAVGVLVLWPRADRVTEANLERITEANLERIKEGMSRAEVEAILGAPGRLPDGPRRDGLRHHRMDARSAN
jgi:outer membrane protein assembly factor BamE (lipoprotein component of BamABCDE complex)